MATSENSNTMDIDELTEGLRTDDPELAPAEAEFIEAVEAAKSVLAATRSIVTSTVSGSRGRAVYRRAADP